MFKVLFCFFFISLSLFISCFSREIPQSLMMPLQKSLSSWHKPLVIAKLVTMSQSTSMWTSSYRPGRIKCGFCLCCRDFTSLVVARSPVTLKRTTCPGFTHSQHLQRHQLRYQPGNATNTKYFCVVKNVFDYLE